MTRSRQLSWYVLKRLLDLVFVMWFVATVTFILLRIVPGDPVQILTAIEALDPAAIEQSRRELGLDQPLVVQYLVWLGDLVRGDLGASLRSGVSVVELVAGSLPATVELAFLSMIIGLGISIPLGVAAARRQHRLADLTITSGALVGISVPSFVLALAGIYLFSIYLRILPTGGYTPIWEDPVENLRRMVLPSLTLGLVTAGMLVRLMRRSLIDELRQDYVRTARAKGANELQVVYKHAMRNAAIPYVTLAGIEAGALLSGAVITETIFAIPGLGRLIIEHINTRDYPVVQGTVFLIAGIYVLINFIVDLIYSFLDPRVVLR